MSKTIDYFFSPPSPWTYLGHERLYALATEHRAVINVFPFDVPKLFAATGGVAVAQRSTQRQNYRISELKRWKSFLQSPIIIRPEYFPYNATLVSLIVVAVVNAYGSDKAMEVSLSLMKGCWVENRNMASPDEVRTSLENCGLNGDELLGLAANDQSAKDLERNTQYAIDSGVFGAPTYIIGGELFWGQDRLDFVKRSLKKS
ncbi:MAG: 2-hydroxychromene-2-carboxylate isomerase [Proteobacteria bacterium]|nr:2-hydroxychromene-2-carboxylate isomerase [Pseudomonadota bacterium]